MMPFMYGPMPMPSIGAQPTAELQRLTLQNQQLQLRMLKQTVAQHLQSIDAALAQVEESLAKAESAEGEKSGEAAAQMLAPQILAQAQAMSQAQAMNQAQALGQVQAQARALASRFDPRRADFRQDWQLQDCQAWYQGGMGEFGRPVF